MGKKTHTRSDTSIKKRRKFRKRVKKEKIKQMIHNNKILGPSITSSGSDIQVVGDEPIENLNICTDHELPELLSSDLDEEDLRGTPISDLELEDSDSDSLPTESQSNHASTESQSNHASAESQCNHASTESQSNHTSTGLQFNNASVSHSSSVFERKLEKVPGYKECMKESWTKDPLEVGFLLWRRQSACKQRLERALQYDN